MSTEYHGWVALATSHDNWADSDFEEADRRVIASLRQLEAEDGHEAVLPDGMLLPRVVYFKGRDVKSLDSMLRVLQEIATAFDRAYGEVAAFDNNGDQDAHFDLALATRYRLFEGKVTNTKS